jgi:hypothetical protein
MRSIMIVGLEGSRRRLEQVLRQLLKIKGVKVFYVSWPRNEEEGGDRREGGATS